MVDDLQKDKDEKIARKGFLKKALGIIAGISLVPSITKAFDKKYENREGEILNSGGKTVQSQNPFVGEIQIVAFSFAPVGWASCNGQLLPINQYQALFSLLGTTYGGDGITNFALPDLRSRVPIHAGQGNGLSIYNLGQIGGEELHTLSINELPAHTHELPVSNNVGTSDMPENMYLAQNSEGVKQFAASANSNAANPGMTGQSAPHNNIQPYLAINYIIALNGIFPTHP